MWNFIYSFITEPKLENVLFDYTAICEHRQENENLKPKQKK